MNIDKPEANGEFFVLPIGNIQGVKPEERFAGFSIQVMGDMCWIRDDDDLEVYSAKVWGEDAILVMMPAFPFYVYKHQDKMVVHSDISRDVNNECDDARHSFVNDMSNQKFKFYLLEFPPGVNLSSSKIFSEAGDEEELDYELVDYKCRVPGEMIDRKDLWIHFTFARTNNRATKCGKVQEKQKKKSHAAQKLIA